MIGNAFFYFGVLVVPSLILLVSGGVIKGADFWWLLLIGVAMCFSIGIGLDLS